MGNPRYLAETNSEAPAKALVSKGAVFFHRNFAVNGLVSGKIFTGNIQKHPETMFFSQKHLRCLGSRLVTLTAGERD